MSGNRHVISWTCRLNPGTLLPGVLSSDQRWPKNTIPHDAEVSLAYHIASTHTTLHLHAWLQNIDLVDGNLQCRAAEYILQAAVCRSAIERNVVGFDP